MSLRYHEAASAAIDAVDAGLASRVGVPLLPEESVALKLWVKGYLERGGNGPVLNAMFLDISMSICAVATSLMWGDAEGDELADGLWAAMKIRIETFEALSKLKGDNSHEVQHTSERRDHGGPGTVTAGGEHDPRTEG